MIKISSLVLVTVAFFYLGKHWSEDGYHQLVFFSGTTNSNSVPEISISSKLNKTFNISTIIEIPAASQPSSPTVLMPNLPLSMVYIFFSRVITSVVIFCLMCFRMFVLFACITRFALGSA
ncbi:unnamed protein product [Cochlearia groenlandica]